MKLTLGYILSNILGIGLLIYMIREARSEKVPTKTIVFMVIIGCLSIFPIIILQTAFGMIADIASINSHPLLQEIVMVPIRLALIEELCKFLGTKILTWKGNYFSNSYQGLLFPAIVSLSFGIVENLLFVALSLQQFQDQFWTIIILRAFLGAPAHGAYGILIGIFYGKAKHAEHQNDRPRKYKYLSFAVLTPTCIHGLYNWLTTSQIVKIGDTSIVSSAVMVVDVIVILCAYYTLYREKTMAQTFGDIPQ